MSYTGLQFISGILSLLGPPSPLVVLVAAVLVLRAPVVPLASVSLLPGPRLALAALSRLPRAFDVNPGRAQDLLDGQHVRAGGVSSSRAHSVSVMAVVVVVCGGPPGGPAWP